MNRVDRAFRGVRSFAGDVWVADYTEQTFNSRKCHTYLNIAMPSHEAGKAPFSAFLVPQDEQLKWIKKNKIHLMGYNEILIVNEGILLAPPPVI